MSVVPLPHLREPLQRALKEISTGCTGCGVCVRGCAFLQAHGTPGSIAHDLDPRKPDQLSLAFSCSLCGLCDAVCPQNLKILALFLEMRREAVLRGSGDFKKHAPLLTYENRGTSPLLTFYGLPVGCDTVFFPGCSLAGTRPSAVLSLYDLLQKSRPALGIVFDCCLKPSHSLGKERRVDLIFSEMREYLLAQGVRRVLVACPNCREMFRTFGGGLETGTVYEELTAIDLPVQRVEGTVTVHDPCAIRSAEPVHSAVRELIRSIGLTVEEMPHSGRTTLCCGQGGGVNLLAPSLAGRWGKMRRDEAAGRRIVTYCAACAETLGCHTPSSHLLDLLFSGGNAMKGRLKPSKPPFTYLNRLRLKRRFKNRGGYAVTREKEAVASGKKKPPIKPLLMFAFLAAAIFAVHASGITSYLDQERLRSLIAPYGRLAPALYVAVYALAPVLFLPGLPITVAGGILFGPVWGVVYAITGATIGASLAFLVARYAARDWVAAKLTGERWRKLDRDVERHGWKVVAFTRLIPLFPFNLLNYAFGLTKVPFRHYVAASFICMLPACIAYIVFSSSLLDLIRGKVSANAVIGIILIVAVSFIPVLYRRFRGKGGPDE